MWDAAAPVGRRHHYAYGLKGPIHFALSNLVNAQCLPIHSCDCETELDSTERRKFVNLKVNIYLFLKYRLTMSILGNLKYFMCFILSP